MKLSVRAKKLDTMCSSLRYVCMCVCVCVCSVRITSTEGQMKLKESVILRTE